MADFLRIKTLESDDEMTVEEDSDDEAQAKENTIVKKKSKKKAKSAKPEQKEKKKLFDAGFDFAFGEAQTTNTWALKKSVKEKAKGMASIAITDEHIRKRRLVRESRGKTEEDVDGKEDTVMVEGDNPTVQAAAVEMGDDVDDDEGDEEEEEEEEEGDDDESFFAQAPKTKKGKTFAQMNLSRPLLKAVNELGYTAPTPIQSTAIPVGLLGKDICACATTGSGKTAAFMLPILERLLFRPKQNPVSRVLVLVPTRELAIQVHSVSEALAKHSTINVCLAAGGMDSKAQEAALRGQPDIIIATPGRLIDHLHNTPSFDLTMIEILVLDEADRMLEEHFREQLNEIIRLAPRGRQTLLFSATMTDEVEALISLSLNHPVKLFIDQNTDVAFSLHQEFVRIRASREADRMAIVTALCVRSFNENTLIFVQTKHLAHKLRIVLGLQGVNCTELHGNLSQLQRLEALEKFKNDQVDVLIATDLAARGLDIHGVKTVISFNLPTTIKSYIHRVGRTARAGKAGRSITLVGEKERKLLKDVVKNAKVPVKNRIVPVEVVDKYRKVLADLEQDVKFVLKEEEEEKQMRIADMHVRKAENLIVHHDEIMSRPARTYIDKNPSAAKDKKQLSKTKEKKQISPEEAKCIKDQMFLKRITKRELKPKRIRAYQEDDPKTNNKAKKKKPNQKSTADKPATKSGRSFEDELTDTSKKSVKGLRYEKKSLKSSSVAKKKSGFKSKAKHKRR